MAMSAVIAKPDDQQAERCANRLARRKAGARRTAWIIAAIAIAFFVASLVQGHFVGIPNWVPTQ